MKRGMVFAAVASLGMGSEAMGCSSHSNPGWWALPGFMLTAEHVGPVLVILAAVFERPFWSWGGVVRGALAASLQANLIAAVVTLLVGFGVVLVMQSEAGFMAAIPVSLLVSVWVKRTYVGWRVKTVVPWRYAVGAVMVSSLVTGSLPFWVKVLPRTFSQWQIQKWRGEIVGYSLLGALLVFAVAFLWRRYEGLVTVKRAREPVHGFDVMAGASIVRV